MFPMLPKLTDKDLEVCYSRKRKISVSSTGSSGASSPCSFSSSVSTSTDQSKKSHRATTSDDFLIKKRTAPSKFCPKPKAPTNRFQPAFIEEKKITKTPYVAKPLQHIPKPPPRNPESSTNMKEYKEFRMLEWQKAQAAKLDGPVDEPPMKKRAQRKRREFRQFN
ncbi:hypothetical protein CAEBREN_20537 [Caenorhabditis brenneri]|uniref:Uncharacterized protein n=1 Tax=Caenorhabditis brenneri TaxID=135651 RepID=G0MLL2_CAEBE|nr:hypothetical protein CAEBREN_20537 [Caenorhabditis brenneri]